MTTTQQHPVTRPAPPGSAADVPGSDKEGKSAPPWARPALLALLATTALLYLWDLGASGNGFCELIARER